MTTVETPLAASRRRDVDRRRARVQMAIADMYSEGSDITIASTATRADVHRSFIHRHPDLHAAVLKSAAEAMKRPSPAATSISHRSVLAENANLHELNRRLSQRIRDLEDRLSEILGQQAFERSGLGAPTATTTLQEDLEHHKQLVIDLTARIGELDEELAAAREANRGLMAQLNRP
jgi:chromosome segregation ATPase